MQELPLQGHYQAGALEVLQQSPLFGSLQPQEHETILNHGKLFEYEAGEMIVEEGQPSDSFYVIVRGQASVSVRLPSIKQMLEISRIGPPGVFGEMGLLLRNARTATVRALDEVLVLRFHHRAFDLMLNSIKGFSIQMCVLLALRLAQTSHRIPPPIERSPVGSIDPQLLRQLPAPFILRHRVLPLQLTKNILTLGFVDEPTQPVIQMVQRVLPGVQVQPTRISNDAFAQTLRNNGLYEQGSADSLDSISNSGLEKSLAKGSPQELPAIVGMPEERQEQLEKLRPLLQRMIEEGASDLYLSGRERPRWRIGETLYVIEDHRVLEPLEPFAMLAGLLPTERIRQFESQHAIDFSCTVTDLARFRVQIFRSEKGMNAILRSIPLAPPHPKQLQLPSALRHITQYSDGLVLFTGPSASGKTTTIAALLEVINHQKSVHIVTLEDPIEYLHTSQRALFHQREVGSHTSDIRQALREVLRNAPDVLVVSDIRDHEVLSLVMEAARNGCLVFASMKVRGAVRTLGHLIDMFPVEQQQQSRLLLGKVLRCVVSQELCRHIAGGRVAAFEYLAVDESAADAIRQGHPAVLIKMLDEHPNNLSSQVHLAQLVQNGHITAEEAYSHTANRDALDALLGNRSLPMLRSESLG